MDQPAKDSIVDGNKPSNIVVPPIGAIPSGNITPPVVSSDPVTAPNTQLPPPETPVPQPVPAVVPPQTQLNETTETPVQTNNIPSTSSVTPPEPSVQTPPNYQDGKIPIKEDPVFKTPDSSKKSINFMMILGPLFMIGALTFSYYNLSVKKQSAVNVSEPKTIISKTEAMKNSMKLMFANSPTNPSQISAICKSTKEKLKSEDISSCPDPEFNWEGAQTKETGTNISGYYVYFGTNSNDSPVTANSSNDDINSTIDPKRDGIFQSTNIYDPQELEKGKKYYLAIRAVSDSKTKDFRTGFDDENIENVTARFAKILFVYDYQ